MTGPQITRGPWAVVHWASDNGVVAVDPPTSSDNRGCAVARCYGSDAEANAKAIAALPLMVKALQLAAPHGRKLQHGPNVSVPANAYVAMVEALEAAGVIE